MQSNSQCLRFGREVLGRITGSADGGPIRTYIHKVSSYHIVVTRVLRLFGSLRCTRGRISKPLTKKWRKIRIGKWAGILGLHSDVNSFQWEDHCNCCLILSNLLLHVYLWRPDARFNYALRVK
jgi:hypothetical protein